MISTSRLVGSAIVIAGLSGCVIEKTEDATCSSFDPCGDHGTCADVLSDIECHCDTGWAGPVCAECDDGFHMEPAGICVADQTCAVVDCGSHGSCAVVDGVAACTCDEGYAAYGGNCIGICDDPDGDAYGDGAGCVGDDNCPAVANYDQADWDGDGVGDACDDPDHISAHRWSPDGSRMAFVRCPTGQTWECELWVSDPDRGNAELIYTGVRFGGLADWQDDGILFTPDHEDGKPGSYNGEGDYFLIAPDGTGLHQVTFTFSDGIRTTFSNPYWDNIGTVGWARLVPGAGKVYFTANDGNGWYQTYLTDADGSDGWSGVSGPYAWLGGISPAGDKLLYGASSNYNTAVTIHAVNLGGGGDVVVASGVTPPVQMAVSPDGSRLAYVGAGAGDPDIHVVGMNGSGDTVLYADAAADVLSGFGASTSLFGDLGSLPWTPDSARVIFSSTRAGNAHLFAGRVDGSGLLQVTDTTAYEFSPDVSPDGAFLAYHRLAPDYTSLEEVELVVEPLLCAP